MKNLHTLVFSLIFFAGSAQDAQKEINDQVWKIFIESFNNFDTDRFMSVHSKDLARSPRDANSIIDWEEYRTQNLQGDTRSKELKRNRNIELRFSQRISNKNLAMDVGIYKTSYIVNGETRSSYGRFHVVLRKEGSGWKILVDTDSSEGNTIGEKDFLAAKVM